MFLSDTSTRSAIMRREMLPFIQGVSEMLGLISTASSVRQNKETISNKRMSVNE
jgi:hypothetical protein